MDYLPVYEDDVAGPSSVSGLATVDIDPAHQQLIGLKTVEVDQGPVGGAWRTVGQVAIDETRVRRINVKVAGFVERVYVDFVGKKVKRGDPLFSLYSPDLLSAQEELLLALKTKGALTKSGGVVSVSPRRPRPPSTKCQARAAPTPNTSPVAISSISSSSAIGWRATACRSMTRT